MGEEIADFLVIGRVVGLYGVKGWVKIHSYSRPRENIRNYSPWYLRMDQSLQRMDVTDIKEHGKGMVALLEGVSDRNAAMELLGTDILIRREQLPALGEGEHYWSDLIGMVVVTMKGLGLGTVTDILETGANDVLVIRGEREHMIPYVKGVYIMGIDIPRRCIQVDWDPDN
jgi:16S rRNA processing protein RimM